MPPSPIVIVIVIIILARWMGRWMVFAQSMAHARADGWMDGWVVERDRTYGHHHGFRVTPHRIAHRTHRTYIYICVCMIFASMVFAIFAAKSRNNIHAMWWLRAGRVTRRCGGARAWRWFSRTTFDVVCVGGITRATSETMTTGNDDDDTVRTHQRVRHDASTHTHTRTHTRT